MNSYRRISVDAMLACLGGFEEPLYPRRRFVSDDDVLLIKLRCVDKLPYSVIAERLGWAPQTLMLRAMQLGIAVKRTNKKHRKKRK